jgi:hypothetical protein
MTTMKASTEHERRCQGCNTGEHTLTFLDVTPPANARCTRCWQNWETAAEWLATPCVPPGVEPTLIETGATKREDPYSEFDEAAAMLKTIERVAKEKAEKESAPRLI